MAFDVLNAVDIIETMENYLQKVRPPEDMRDKLDVGYRIEGQSIVVFETRPKPFEEGKTIESEFAKTTFVKSQQSWKIYWMRGNLKWTLYEPMPEVRTLTEFLQVVEEDAYGCFHG